MNKPKTKHRKSRTGWWLIERTCLFITSFTFFAFNCLSLLLPVYVLTEITRTADFAWHILVLLAMLFTWIAIRIYYRLIRWLERKNPLLALTYIVIIAGSFGMFCLIAALPFMVIDGLIITTLFGPLTDTGSAAISGMFVFLTPQITLLFIILALMLSERILRRNLALASH